MTETVDQTVEQTVQADDAETLTPEQQADLDAITGLVAETETKPETAAETTEEAPAEPEVAEPAAPASEPADTIEPEPAPANQQVQAQQETAQSTQRLQAAQAATQRQQRLAAITREIAALKDTTIDDFDAKIERNEKIQSLLIEKDGLRDAELGELRMTAQQVAEQQQVETFWSNFGLQNPGITAKEGRELWDSIALAAAKKYGAGSEGAQAVANEKFEERIKLLKAQRAAKQQKAPAAPVRAAAPAKPAPAAAAPKGGGTVVPAAKTTRPPAPQPRTMDEHWNQFAQSAGDPHDYFTR